MRIRWMSAGLATFALALFVTVGLPPPSGDTVSALGAATCALPARHANLNFRLKDTNGRDVRLADYAGKVLLVDFWATWCGPCQVEIPGFVRLYKKYRSQGFEILGVVLQDRFANARPFARRFGMEYPVLDGTGQNDLEDAFGPMVGLPTSFLITRDGTICHRHVGLPPWKSGHSPEAAVEDVFESEIRSLL